MALLSTAAQKSSRSYWCMAWSLRPIIAGELGAKWCVLELHIVGDRVVVRTVVQDAVAGGVWTPGLALRLAAVVRGAPRRAIAALKPTPRQVGLVQQVTDGADVGNRHQRLRGAVVVQRFFVEDHVVADCLVRKVALIGASRLRRSSSVLPHIRSSPRQSGRAGRGDRPFARPNTRDPCRR